LALRVYNLSRAFGVTTTEIIQVCRRCGVPVRSHSSSIKIEYAERVLKYYKEKGREPVEPIDLTPPKPKPKKKVAKKKVAKKPAKKKTVKKKKAETEADEAETGAVAVAEADAPEKAKKVKAAKKKAPKAKPKVEEGAIEVEAVSEAPVEGKEERVETPEAQAETAGAEESQTLEKDGEKAPLKKQTKREEVKRLEPVNKTTKLRKPKVRIIERRELTPEQLAEIQNRFTKPKRRVQKTGATPAGAALGSPAARSEPQVFVPPKDGGAAGGRSRRKGKSRRGHTTPKRPEDRYMRFHKPVVEQVFVKPDKIDVDFPPTLKDLSGKMGIKANVLTKKLLEHGHLVTINQLIDDELIEILTLEFDIEINVVKSETKEDQLLAEARAEDKPEDLVRRAPIVTLLGHVDHGKTSILDALRNTRVAAGEVGGITQKLGAYEVQSEKGPVVFLDTPGHEAFTMMRSRGAHVTDVAVLIVAADDGVMPQTIEAINHARDAKVPIVVAINKCDLPAANPMRVRQQLAGYDLSPEEWGGQTVMVDVSAVKGTALPDLVEMLSLESELLELKANSNKPALGTVLEASMCPGRGVVATLLVQDGTLKRGDIILAGNTYGRVKNMIDDLNKQLEVAGPSKPVQVTGLNSVPEAGDRFQVVADLSKARSVADDRERKARLASMARRKHITLDNLFQKLQEGETKELKMVLKADSMGALEALSQMLAKLGSDEVRVQVIHSAVGGINESDVLLADASDAIIIGFTVHPEERARVLAHERGVEIRLYQIIYKVQEDIHMALEGMLDAEKLEEVVAHVEVRQLFKVSRIGTIAGCRVTDGTIERTSRVRLIRDGITVMPTGELESLKREKDDAREVRSGFECGIKIAGYDDIKVGDIIEAYRIVERLRTLGK